MSPNDRPSSHLPQAGASPHEMAEKSSSRAGHPAGEPENDSQGASAADCAMKDTRQASQCDCAGQCDLRAATQCLYRTTIDILSRAGDGPLPDTLPLLRPMSTVVGRFKTRQGQDACAAFAMSPLSR